MIAFTLPSLGADMDEGTLLEWKVAPGEKVARGQVIAVVDTSKAAVDVEIWHDGVVGELRVSPGERIPVGATMATILEAGEAPSVGEPVPATPVARAVPVAPAAPGVPVAPAAPGVPVAPATPDVPVAPAVVAAAAPIPSHLPSAEALTAAARHPVSPAARRRARELDVDPVRVSGTGPGGAVTIADVERAAAAREASRAAATTLSTSPTGATTAVPAATTSTATPATTATTATSATSATSATISLPGSAPSPTGVAAADRARQMRRAIAAAMSRSKREIPHYYLREPIPMARALDWLAQRNAQRPITERVLPAVLQLKAVACALERTPELNGFFRDDAFVPADAAHVGVAISQRGGGLVAPAIHDVRAKSLDRLMRELSDLVRRARAFSLRSSELTDPTITVTNLGDQGSESVLGVIYPPQVALVGFGRVTERAWAQDGALRALPVVDASLAADHRVSDGHRGAIFLVELRELLQHPESLDPGA